MGKLDRKVALVTGAARGIGKAVALTLAREGADVVVNYVKSHEQAEEVTEEIRQMGRRAKAVQADVSKKQAVEKLVETTVADFERLDILVNNAGITRHASLLEMAEEDWDLVLAVNLKGAFLCTQTAAQHMVKNKYGKIVNIASIMGISTVFQRQPNYAASKAGLIQLTKNAAIELGPYGINVNAIAAGLIVTDILYLRRSPAEVDRLIDQRSKQSALRRPGTPQDMANIALFLSSEDSSFITGQVIIADGGCFEGSVPLKA
jgi:3-oxoacyl-[acyl-carrier protein] reductase